MLNNLSIAGRLVKDPELRKTNGGVPVCRFTIACDRTTGENKITDFFEVTAWRKNAEFITNYFHKGETIIITGRLETYEYSDRKDFFSFSSKKSLFNAVANATAIGMIAFLIVSS